jgi:hypothetical protein
MTMIRELDTVALLKDVLSEHEQTRRPITVPRRQVGTVVVDHKDGEAFMVEFSGSGGVAFAMPTLRPEQLLALHFEPAAEPTVLTEH